MGRILAIAAGTFVAYGIAKGLDRSFSLSPSAATKFVFGTSSCVGIPYLVNKPSKQELSSEDKHLFYSKNPASWRALAPPQRSELVNEWYQSNQPVIRLKNLKLDRATLDAALLTLEGEISPWQEEILLTQDFRLLEMLQHNPEADYSSLEEFFERYPEVHFLINEPFTMAIKNAFYPTIAPLKRRIRSAADVNALTLAQLRGYHRAFDNPWCNVNYNNRAIHQAFFTQFRRLRLNIRNIRFGPPVYRRPDEEERKVAEL